MDVRNQQSARPEPAPRQEHAGHVPFMKPSLASKTLVILLIVLAVITIGVMGVRVFAATTSDNAVKSKEYQALFLTNGQVYFGHLSDVDSSYVKLSNIYYLQVQQQVQPKDNSQTAQPQISLAKLGGELHGPEDTMYVSRQQVLFWENLKNDGKVAQAISQYQQSGK